MKVYSNISTKRTFCEFWGGSTKHPDSRFCFNEWECYDKSWLYDANSPYELIKWLMSCVANIETMPNDTECYLEDLLDYQRFYMNYVRNS